MTDTPPTKPQRTIAKPVTRHAVDRALQRYDAVLPPAMWTALAESIARGEHLVTGQLRNGCSRVVVQLLRADGSTFTMPLAVDRSGTIVTVLPTKTPKRLRPVVHATERARRRVADDYALEPTRRRST